VAIPVDRKFPKREAENKLIEVFMYRDTTNVELEMFRYTDNRWNQCNSNIILKKHLEAVPGKHSPVTIGSINTECSAV
jgi:hypothetical protein